MISMDVTIEKQESYVAELRIRVRWAKQHANNIEQNESQSLLQGAENTLARMYEDRINKGVSFL